MEYSNEIRLDEGANFNVRFLVSDTIDLGLYDVKIQVRKTSISPLLLEYSTVENTLQKQGQNIYWHIPSGDTLGKVGSYMWQFMLCLNEATVHVFTKDVFEISPAIVRTGVDNAVYMPEKIIFVTTGTHIFGKMMIEQFAILQGISGHDFEALEVGDGGLFTHDLDTFKLQVTFFDYDGTQRNDISWSPVSANAIQIFLPVLDGVLNNTFSGEIYIIKRQVGSKSVMNVADGDIIEHNLNTTKIQAYFYNEDGSPNTGVRYRPWGVNHVKIDLQFLDNLFNSTFSGEIFIIKRS